MPVLFVHGMPSSSRLWKGVIAALKREDEVVAVDLPGFDSPPPAGWVASKENYVDWLIAQIEALAARGGPVHLVGHDWGCLLALRAASLRPELLRSITAGNGPIDEHWPMHALWTTWNQPGAGEHFMEKVLTPEMTRGLLQGAGFPPEDIPMNTWATAEGRAVTLALYRSAVGIGRQWAPDLARIVIPSLLIWGINDLMVPVEIGRRMAARMGAEVATLDAGHFWPYERPQEAAALLRRHFARAELTPDTIMTQSTEVLFAGA